MIYILFSYMTNKNRFDSEYVVILKKKVRKVEWQMDDLARNSAITSEQMEHSNAET